MNKIVLDLHGNIKKKKQYMHICKQFCKKQVNRTKYFPQFGDSSQPEGLQ